MGKISASSDVSAVVDPEEFKRFIQIFLNQVKTTVNGNVSVENLKAALVSVVFTAANADTQVLHNLAVIPRGSIKLSGPNVTIYDGATASTTENIFLRSTGAGTCSILVMG